MAEAERLVVTQAKEARLAPGIVCGTESRSRVLWIG